jgi:hypothetical protein
MRYTMKKILPILFFGLLLTMTLTGCSSDGQDIAGASGWVVMSIGDTPTTNSAVHFSTTQAVIIGAILLLIIYLWYKQKKHKRSK